MTSPAHILLIEREWVEGLCDNITVTCDMPRAVQGSRVIEGDSTTGAGLGAASEAQSAGQAG